jgi:hypothetical protein
LKNKSILYSQDIHDLNEILRNEYWHELFKNLNFFDNNRLKSSEAKEISQTEKIK